jgi:tetrapyrrole methylase family protein/MazG family protein
MAVSCHHAARTVVFGAVTVHAHTDRRPPQQPPAADAGLTIVGLGPGPVDYLTVEAREILWSTPTLWLRTAHHPVVAALPAHVRWYACDDLFLLTGQRKTGLARLVRHLLTQARQPGGVVYAVPGHPLIGDAAGRQVIAATQRAGIPTRVVAGLSFVEPVCTALGLDPLANGLQIVDAAQLLAWQPHPPRPRAPDDRRLWRWLLQRARPPFDPTRPLLIAQARGLLRRLRPLLLERYPKSHEAALIDLPERPGPVPARELALDALGRATIDAYALYVPPIEPLDAVADLTGLRTVVARLRAPGGCPWDREQTHETLKQYLVEETYEVLEAIENGNPRTLADELGDVLLQVVLHTQLAAEAGHFTLEDVLRAITTKLVRRHPHVFGDVSVADAAEVVRNWEQIKQREKASARRRLAETVPRHLPALAYAQAIQRKVARYGFDWPTVDGVLDKVAEEVAELRRETNDVARRREAGDLLFAIVNALRWLKIDAEEALRQANRRFGRRFQRMEELAERRGLALDQLDLDALDALWNEAKLAERHAAGDDAR